MVAVSSMVEYLVGIAFGTDLTELKCWNILKEFECWSRSHRIAVFLKPLRLMH